MSVKKGCVGGNRGTIFGRPFKVFCAWPGLRLGCREIVAFGGIEFRIVGRGKLVDSVPFLFLFFGELFFPNCPLARRWTLARTHTNGEDMCVVIVITGLLKVLDL